MPGTVNDAAIVTSPDGKDHVVIVVFSKAGTSDEKVREDDVAAVAKKAYQHVIPSVSEGSGRAARLNPVFRAPRAQVPRYARDDRAP